MPQQRIDATKAPRPARIPVELANGPSIPLWASGECLRELATITRQHPDWPRLHGLTMMSARGNWSRACARWRVDMGYGTPADDPRGRIAVRRPFWP